MLRFGDRDIAKRPITICEVNVDNIVISKLFKSKANFKYSMDI